MRILTLSLLVPFTVATSFFQASSQVPNFIDYTDSVGLSSTGILGGKVAWGDFNNDGWVDMFDGRVLRNDSGIAFTEVYAVPGIGLWGDYDNDGLLDIFSYEVGGGGQYHNEGNDSFSHVINQFVPAIPAIASRGATWGDFNLDGYLDVYIGGYETPGYSPDFIYTNNGSGTFNQTWSTVPEHDPARGVTACDFDEDGDLDIYVSNYRLEANVLLQNDGSGTFTNVADIFGVAGIYDGSSFSYGFSIGACWGDLDNDGDIDLFAGNFSHPPITQDRPRFYENLGVDSSYHFADRSDEIGLAWQESFSTPVLADFNNDGYIDLFYATVYIGDHSVLLTNDGNWSLTDVTNLSGLTNLPITYQAASADFDNDGYMDLVVGGRLYKNVGGDNDWIKVHLVGTCARTNSAAIGAQVRVFVGNEVFTRQVEGGTGEGNQNELRLHFGLGNMTGLIDSLVVSWPGGNKQTIYDLEVNQVLEVVEDPIELNIPDTVHINLNDQVTIGSNPIQPYYYSWNTGDTTAQITVSPDSSATYYVTVGDSNCVKMDSVRVEVGSMNSLEFIDARRFSIYPNPFSDHATVDFASPGVAWRELKIYDAVGRVVRSWSYFGQSVPLKRGNLPKGVYILEITSDAVYRKQIVVH